jgi:hypothetical protein
MDVAAFKASLKQAQPPRGLSSPLEALWWAAKDDWTKAHEIAQEHEDKPAAWVHAYLHRVEGDLGNAGYWYRQAGRPPATGALPAEWERIAAALLEGA